MSEGWEALLILPAGFIYASTMVPIIALSLARGRESPRAVAFTSAICVILVVLGVFGDLPEVTIPALYFVGPAAVLTLWRYVAYEKIQFSLRAILVWTFFLASLLAIVVPRLPDLAAINKSELPWLMLWVAIHSLGPAIVLWASLALQRRIWVVSAFVIAISLANGSRLGVGDFEWRRALLMLLVQVVYASSLIAFTRTMMCNLLVIYPEPYPARRRLAPGELIVIPSEHNSGGGTEQ